MTTDFTTTTDLKSLRIEELIDLFAIQAKREESTKTPTAEEITRRMQTPNSVSTEFGRWSNLSPGEEKLVKEWMKKFHP